MMQERTEMWESAGFCVARLGKLADWDAESRAVKRYQLALPMHRDLGPGIQRCRKMQLRYSMTLICQGGQGYLTP
jgi:hypothetical protein